MEECNSDRTEDFTLYALAKRAIALATVYKSCVRYMIRQGSAATLANQKRWILEDLHLPDYEEQLSAECIDVVQGELTRWLQKHVQLFTSCGRKFYNRSRHLNLFLEDVSWEKTRIKIDDWRTALKIIAANEDWPLLQFQFCCAYAMEPQLCMFSFVELRSFKHHLADHPMFELWFRLLEQKRQEKGTIFDYGGHTPHQTVSDAFQWAVQFGYLEAAQFIWYKICPWQKEYLGMLHWRKLVTRANDVDLFQFICNHLQATNPRNLTRITGQIFLNNLRASLENKRLQVLPNQQEADPWTIAKFLLDNSGPSLRKRLLAVNKYQAFAIAAVNRDLSTFRDLALYLSDRERSGIQGALKTQIKDDQILSFLCRYLDTLCMEP